MDEELEERVLSLMEQGQYALQANRHADAEDFCGQACYLAGMAANDDVTVTSLYYYAMATSNLAVVLGELGATPEAVPILEQSAIAYRRLVASGVTDVEPAFAAVLLDLAKSYRGVSIYLESDRPPIFDVDEMREYRRERMARGAWRGAVIGLVSVEQKAKSEAVLLELLQLLRRLVRADRAGHEGDLALTLYLLGEATLEGGQLDEAEAYLREAEAMYRMLILSDCARYQPMLTDTLFRLSLLQVPGGDAADRISILEELLPGLRVAAAVSDDEIENGMTLAKSDARSRLCDVLLELAEAYEDSGQSERSDALWDGELGALRYEVRKIRRG